MVTCACKGRLAQLSFVRSPAHSCIWFGVGKVCSVINSSSCHFHYITASKGTDNLSCDIHVCYRTNVVYVVCVYDKWCVCNKYMSLLHGGTSAASQPGTALCSQSRKQHSWQCWAPHRLTASHPSRKLTLGKHPTCLPLFLAGTVVMSPVAPQAKY